jgi:hypothetical protein
LQLPKENQNFLISRLCCRLNFNLNIDGFKEHRITASSISGLTGSRIPSPLSMRKIKRNRKLRIKLLPFSYQGE